MTTRIGTLLMDSKNSSVGALPTVCVVFSVLSVVKHVCQLYYMALYETSLCDFIDLVSQSNSYDRSHYWCNSC